MPVASDCGDCLFTAFEIENTEIVAPGYYATMGFGVPAALGLQAATGQRPLVLVGDGAFQMTGWELGNCRRYGWDPIVIVMNNRSWEMLRVFQPESKFNTLDDWHFAELAGAARRRRSAGQRRAASWRPRSNERSQPAAGSRSIEAMIPRARSRRRSRASSAPSSAGSGARGRRRCRQFAGEATGAKLACTSFHCPPIFA